MRVECARCGHAEDDTYEFDLPFASAQAMEAYEPRQMPEVRRSDSDAPEANHL